MTSCAGKGLHSSSSFIVHVPHAIQQLLGGIISRSPNVCHRLFQSVKVAMDCRVFHQGGANVSSETRVLFNASFQLDDPFLQYDSTTQFMMRAFVWCQFGVLTFIIYIYIIYAIERSRSKTPSLYDMLYIQRYDI